MAGSAGVCPAERYACWWGIVPGAGDQTSTGSRSEVFPFAQTMDLDPSADKRATVTEAGVFVRPQEAVCSQL